MNVVLERLLENECKMGTLCTVAIMVAALVVHLCHCHVEHSLCSLNLTGYLWKIGDFERRPILVYDIHHRNIMEKEITVFYSEFSLWPVECLLHQIDVLVLHIANPSKLVYQF